MNPLYLPVLVFVFAMGSSFSTAADPVAEPARSAHNPNKPSLPSGKALTIVEQGQPRAEIVIAAERPRMVTLAALELRKFLQEITGARLPIVTAPSDQHPIKIFVGNSPGVEKLGIRADGLDHGAYRMVTGPDWFVLLGKDSDFDDSKLPIPKTRGGIPKAQEQWEKAVKESGKTDVMWGFPFAGLYKRYWQSGTFAETLIETYGEDAVELWNAPEGERPALWQFDEGGSLNAVYAFLNGLGVQWFMPGELGQVLPKPSPTLTVGPFDESVVPDFAIREWIWYNFGAFSFENVIWARRIGMNSSAKLQSVGFPHGLVRVHSHESMKQAHPEYYALIGGKRDTEHRGYGTACYTSQGLINETVNYARFLFDTYDLPGVDIWPGDGLKVCQCDGCKGKNASELVWGFTDRVAREVYKTHPDRFISSGAYTSYINPPESIEKFSPNLVVWISNSARPKMLDSEHWKNHSNLVQAWNSKLAPGRLARSENNRYHIWGDNVGYPVIFPRAAARELKALKGISQGETGEQSQSQATWHKPALDHITLYIQSRLLWDADHDVDELLDEYCQMFYGPAASQMKAAIDFAEANLAFHDRSRSGGRGNPMNVSLQIALKLRKLLDEASAAAGDTLYGQRVQAVINSLQPRDQLIAAYAATESALAEARAKAPVAKGSVGADLSKASLHTLRANRGNDPLSAETTFRAAWQDNSLLLEITCHEPKMAEVVSSDDVYNGDHVAVMLETPNHSFYSIQLNPDGAVVEGNPTTSAWKSLAAVETEKGADFWRVVLKIPTVGIDEAESDPHHRVSGSKPTAEAPWYFNIGRNRVGTLDAPEAQAFSPTGGPWHTREKFGKLIIE